MKKYLGLLLLSMFAVSMSAQQTMEQVMEINKTSLQGYSITIPNATAEQAEGAIKNTFSKYGFKLSKKYGYYAIINQKFETFGTDNYDIFFNTSETGKKKNRSAVISLICCKGNMNAISSSSDPEIAARIKGFLNDSPAWIDLYQTNEKIALHNDEYAKLSKERESLINSKSKLQKELESADKKISDMDTKLKSIQSSLDELKGRLPK